VIELAKKQSFQYDKGKDGKTPMDIGENVSTNIKITEFLKASRQSWFGESGGKGLVFPFV